MRALSTVLCLTINLSWLFAAQAAVPFSLNDKKIIYHGWNTRDSLYVSQHWAEMEQMPFDGIGIGIALDRSRATIGDGSTGNLLGWHVFGLTAFSLGSFSDAIADLQKPAWSRFTDNFLPVAIATRDQDQGLSWFDDARWATIENNWRVLVTIAREGHCRGLLLDTEQYDYECELFNYSDHSRQRVDRPFEEYAAAARERGRRLGAAIREVFPDITVALLYGYTLPAQKLRPGLAAQDARYALMPAFLDGLLEGSGSEAKFIDLWEFGHGYKKRDQFLRARAEILNAGNIVSKDPAKYQIAMKVGTSVRLDFPNRGSEWQSKYPDKNYFSPNGFEMALRAAQEASDRYVWIYSEDKPQFFPRSSLPEQYLQAIRASRFPGKTASAAPLIPISLGLAGFLALGLWIPRQRFRRRSVSARHSSIRVLIVTGIFPPDRGGPASYVPKMAAALVQRGHEVEIVCLSEQIGHDDSQYPFRVRRLRRRQFWPLRICRTVATIWRRARSNELIYVNGLGAESAIAAALAGRPAVHKVVGDYAWERAVGRGWFGGTIDEYQAAKKRLRLRVIDFIRKFPLRLATEIIVPSCYLRGIVSGWEIPKEKIRVIPNAVAAVSDSTVPAPLPIWPGKTLITICRLVPWKGVEGLIRLLPELPDTRLVVAGNGHLRAELEAIAHSVDVAARVVFLGNVSHSSVHSYLARSDAFVLNSTYEGLPHVVLEAMVAGIPVIATNAGGTGEVIEHNVTGLLVPVGDQAALKAAIESLWRDPALGHQLAEEARARSRIHFDFEAMVSATEQTLRGALTSPGLMGSGAMEAKS